MAWPEADDPQQSIELQWLGILAHVGGKADSWIERNLEEAFNVQLEPMYMDRNGFQQRRPLMLCAGDIPDVMWDGDPLGVRANLRHGFIMELPYEVILKHAPTYVRYLNQFGREAWLYSHYEGKNYGLPTFSAGANRPRISCWRGDWLDNVGIEQVPETIDDMYEALRRFRHDDPDQNGKQDTYGWSPDIWHWSLAFVEIFAAYDTLAFDFIERDGKVVWGGILPETKEALTTLHKWHSEGLLDPDFPLNANKAGRGFENGRIGYTHPVDQPAFLNPELTGTLGSKVTAHDPNARLVPGPPLRNAQGQRRGRTWGGAAHVMQFGKHLQQQPEKVIRVLHMLETCAANEELYMQARYGKRGTHWEFSPEEGRIPLPPYDSDKRLSSAELLPSTIFFFPSSIDPIFDDAYNSAKDNAWHETNRKHAWAMKNVLGKSDIVPSASQYLRDLRLWQMTVFVEMITGKRPLGEFDAFVAEWQDRGGEILTWEANEMFSQMAAIYSRVGATEVAP